MPLYGFFHDHILTFSKNKGYQYIKRKKVISQMVLECLKTAHKARKKTSGRLVMTRILQLFEFLFLQGFSELLTCTRILLIKLEKFLHDQTGSNVSKKFSSRPAVTVFCQIL